MRARNTPHARTRVATLALATHRTGRCCSPLVAATLVRAARARSVTTTPLHQARPLVSLRQARRLSHSTKLASLFHSTKPAACLTAPHERSQHTARSPHTARSTPPHQATPACSHHSTSGPIHRPCVSAPAPFAFAAPSPQPLAPAAPRALPYATPRPSGLVSLHASAACVTPPSHACFSLSTPRLRVSLHQVTPACLSPRLDCKPLRSSRFASPVRTPALQAAAFSRFASPVRTPAHAPLRSSRSWRARHSSPLEPTELGSRSRFTSPVGSA